jgi:hypothetical protein
MQAPPQQPPSQHRAAPPVPQASCPAAQQSPALQTRGAAQGASQAPQWSGSVASSTQRPGLEAPASHTVSPAGQPQLPALQIPPLAQVAQAAPQAVGSVRSSTQRPGSSAVLPQVSGVAGGQVQRPEVQAPPLAQAVVQSPQWRGSRCSS